MVQYIRDPRFHAHGMAYKFLDDNRTHWITGDHVIEAWLRSINWANTVVVAHNVRFDAAIMRWHYGAPAPYAYMDTVGLAKAVLGENISSFSLKRIADYLGLPPKGDLSCDGIRNPSPEQLRILGEYCCNDVDVCGGIYGKLMPQFPQGQLFSMDWTIKCFIEPQLVLCEQTLSEGTKKERQRREEVIKASGVEKDVLSSNVKFAGLLRSRGIKVETKISGRTGKEIPAFAKTDGGLDALRTSAPALYDARIASKANLLETRGAALLGVAKSGSFPFDVGFSGAVQTHRYSGGSGAGGNPQNFTRGSFLRAAVSAPAGHSLVVGDFAAIEARLVAWLAKEPKLMTAFAEDIDVYSDFGSVIYGYPVNKHDHPDERRFGKEGILGLGYQMGWFKFQQRVKAVLKKDISEKEAKRVVKLYRDTYFNIPILWENANNLLPLLADGKISIVWFAPFLRARKNALILPSGLSIQYPNLRYGVYFDRKAQEEREGWHYDAFFTAHEPEPVGIYGGMVIENICQALAGELCKESIERAENNSLNCVGQIHDEVMAICPEGQEKESVQVLTKAMETIPYWFPAIKLKSEVGYGKNWNNAKV